MVLDHPGPIGVLGKNRCKRFAFYAEDGVIKHFAVRGSTESGLVSDCTAGSGE